RTEAKLHDDWYRTGSVHRRCERELNINVNERIRRVVHASDKLLRNHGNVAHSLNGEICEGPLHFWRFLWSPSIDFAVECLHDLWAALLPPFFSSCYPLPIFELERIRQ